MLRIELKIGDTYRCPKDHNAKIVWISEDKKTIAVKCPQKHFSKIAKVVDKTESSSSVRRSRTREKKVYVRNTVFLIRI